MSKSSTQPECLIDSHNIQGRTEKRMQESLQPAWHEV